jgi:hypothetical protein
LLACCTALTALQVDRIIVSNVSKLEAEALTQEGAEYRETYLSFTKEGSDLPRPVGSIQAQFAFKTGNLRAAVAPFLAYSSAVQRGKRWVGPK